MEWVQGSAESAVFQTSWQVVEAELRDWLPRFDTFLDEERIQRVLPASDQVPARYIRSGGEADLPTAAHSVLAREPASATAVGLFFDNFPVYAHGHAAWSHRLPPGQQVRLDEGGTEQQDQRRVVHPQEQEYQRPRGAVG